MAYWRKDQRKPSTKLQYVATSEAAFVTGLTAILVGYPVLVLVQSSGLVENWVLHAYVLFPAILWAYVSLLAWLAPTSSTAGEWWLLISWPAEVLALAAAIAIGRVL